MIMKRPTSYRVLTLILIGMLMLAPTASWGRMFAQGLAGNTITPQSLPGQYLVLNQGFDNETTGATPNGWSFSPSNGNFFVDSSIDYLGSGKSAGFIDNSTSGSPGAQTGFLEQRGIFAASFSLLLKNNTGVHAGLEVRVDNGYGAGANIVFGDGVIQYRNQDDELITLRGSYVANRWYRITLLVNVPEHTYDIFIDNHLEVIDLGFTGANATKISRMIVDETMSANPGSLMPVGNIDDIQVRKCIVVPSDYPTIQEGIDAAGPGDIVFVTKQQRYFESPVISKDNLTLVGEDPSSTIIDGRFSMAGPDRISVLHCSGVTISGFTIALSAVGGSQVNVVNSHNVVISNNIIISGLGNGVEVSGSNDTITGNTIQSNLGYGIRIGGQYQSVSDNIIDSNDAGGIRFDCADSNITDNIIQSSLAGGINMPSGTNNLVVNNTIRNNKIGLWCGADTYSIAVYQNRFVGNNAQARNDGHNNRWDDGYPYNPAQKKGGGNYWSDYNSSVDQYWGPNQDLLLDRTYPAPDGIFDQPYNMTQNIVDHYPLFPIQNVTQFQQPGTIDYTTDVTVTATMLHLVNILSATIYVNYTYANLTFPNQTIVMQRGSGDNWSGVIPHRLYGTRVYYNVSVQAESGSPINSTNYPQRGPYFVNDITPPTFPPNSISWAPAGPDANDMLIVSANVTEPADASQVAKVQLSYPVGNSTWWTLMNKVADNNSTANNTSTWTATIPAQPGNATLNFNITAFDVAGNSALENSSAFVRLVAQMSVQYNNGTVADDPGLLDFGIMGRKRLSSTTIWIVNVGQDTLAWNMTILNGDKWLSTNASSGTILGGQRATVNVMVNTTVFNEPSLYAGELAINANGTVSQWAVVVTLTIKYIIIDESSASVEASDRVNVKTPESVAFHAEWAGNCSDATVGTISIPGLTNSANITGWAIFTGLNFSDPGQKVFSVSAVNFGGITDFTQTALSPAITWDRVNVTLSVADSWIDVGSSAVVTWKGVHESDNSAFKGQVFLNDTTVHDKVGNWALNASSIIDSQYPHLTAFDSNSVSVVWDRIEIIAAGTSDSQLDVNQTATVWFIAVYRYENKVFKGGNGTLYVNNDSLVWNPDTEVWAKYPRYDTPGTRTFEVTAVDDQVHGLTVIRDDVGPQNITWGPQPWWQQWLNAALGDPPSGTSAITTSSSSHATQAQDPAAATESQSPEPQSAAASFPWQALVIILASGIIMVIAMLTLLMAGKKPSRTSKREQRGRS